MFAKYMFEYIDDSGWRMLAAHGFNKDDMLQKHKLSVEDLEKKIILQNTYVNLLDVLDFKEIAGEIKNLKKGENFQIGINIDDIDKTNYFKELEMNNDLGEYLTATNNVPILNISNPEHYHPRQAASELAFMYDEATKQLSHKNSLNIKPIVHNMYVRENLDDNKKFNFMLLSLVSSDEYKSSEDIIKGANEKFIEQNMPVVKMLQSDDEDSMSDLVLSIGQYRKRKYGSQPRIHTNGLYQDSLMSHKNKLEDITGIPLVPFRTKGARGAYELNEFYREIFSMMNSK